MMPDQDCRSSLQTGGPPIGAIAKVHGPVVDISCTYLPPLHQALCAALDHETYMFEVYQHLDEQHVRVITLDRTSGLRLGMPVFDTGAPVHVPVAPNCLGRVVNLFGEPGSSCAPGIGPQRLERDQSDLLRQRNILRQEEITEEIEVLMLSTLDRPRPR